MGEVEARGRSSITRQSFFTMKAQAWPQTQIRHFWSKGRGCLEPEPEERQQDPERLQQSKAFRKNYQYEDLKEEKTFQRHTVDSAGTDLLGGTIPPISTSWCNNTLQCHRQQFLRHSVRFLQQCPPIPSCTAPCGKLSLFHPLETCTSSR